MSSGRLGSHDRKVNVGVCHYVEEVGEHVLGDDCHDLDDLSVGVTDGADRLDIRFADLATRSCDRCCERDGGVCLRIRRTAVTVSGDFRGIELGEVGGEVAVRRQAVVAAFTCATASAMRSRVFTSRVFASAAFWLK